MEILGLLKYVFLSFNCVIIYFLRNVRKRENLRNKEKNAQKKILLVTAHPEDESMFFLPAIYNMQDLGYKIHMLCFSNGNSSVRETELKKAAEFMAFDEWTLLDLVKEGIKDGMGETWPLNVIVREIKKYVTENSIDGILTFDEKGVSSHANHIDLHRAL